MEKREMAKELAGAKVYLRPVEPEARPARIKSVTKVDKDTYNVRVVYLDEDQWEEMGSEVNFFVSANHLKTLCERNEVTTHDQEITLIDRIMGD